ncbi:MAG: porin [Sideroxydans sp.]|nr:porin [Sideroxydans sp.]
MNRKIIAMAAVAAMASSTAYAESGNVNIYGVISMSLDSVDNGNGPTAATQGTRVNKVSSNASRLGFKGSEDIGGGLAALWQIESTINVDGTSTSTFATRNSFVGLKSDSMGKLLLGRYDSPYKFSTRKLDAFGLVLADNRSLMGGVAGKSSWMQFDGRRSDTLVYTTPSVAGFSLAAAYVAGAETMTSAPQTNGSAWSLAGIYQMDGLYGTLAYEIHKIGSPSTGALAGTAAGSFAGAGSKESAWKLGMGYQLDAYSLGFVYEKTSDNLGGAGAAAPVATCTTVGQNCYGHNAYYLSGKYRFGSNAVKLAYGKSGMLAGGAAGSDTSARQLSLGYDHSLSKRTMLFALYTRLNNGAGINYGLSTTTVTTGSTVAAGDGASLSGLSFGMTHAF